MPAGYSDIGILFVFAIGLALLILIISMFVGQKKPSPAKYTPYESGIRPLVASRRRVPIKFYLVAMLYIVFDIEVVFFYPWAVTFGSMRNAGMRDFLPFLLLEVAIFIAILLIGYLYVWRKGAFNWE